MSEALLYAKLAGKFGLLPSQVDQIPVWLLSVLDGDEPATTT